MKSLFTMVMLSIALCLTLATSFSFAQETAVPTATPTATQEVVAIPVEEVSTGTFVDNTADAIKQIGVVTKQEGVPKLTIVLGVILIIAQLLIQFTKTSILGRVFKTVNAKGKLAIVSALTVITTLVPLMINGVSFTAALITGGVLSAMMVAGHQIYEAFFSGDSTPVA